MDFFPRFGAMVSGLSEAALFFPLGEELSIPPFGIASFEEATASLSAPSFPSRGATSNILTSTGSSLVSGRGAGHRISFAFAIHSCIKGEVLLKNKSIVRIEGPGAGSPTLVFGRLRLKPASSVKSRLTYGDPKNSLYISRGVMPMKFRRTR